jgi:hypothetical protein
MLTPMKAIRAKCLDCCCDSFIEVRLCTIEKCPLYPYRMGHRPKGHNDTTETAECENTQIEPYLSEKKSPYPKADQSNR